MTRGPWVGEDDIQPKEGVEEVFVDDETEQPEWIGLGTGFFGMKRVLVPVQGADLTEDGVTVPYSKDKVKDAPDIDADQIDQQTEQALYSHYGLGYSERRSDSGLPEGGPTAGAEDEAIDTGAREPSDLAEGEPSFVRSEEELHVGKRETEAGRMRLRKWVETEPVDVDVELRRETARVTREPIDQPVTGAQIGEDEVEVPLHEEQAVVEKETVAKERIGVDRDVQVEHERVTDDVRKERVDVDEGR